MSKIADKIPTPSVPDPTDSVYFFNSAGTVEGRSLIGDLPVKLDGEAGSHYLDRANHTGTQNSTTITVTPDIKSSGSYSVVSGDRGKIIEIDGALTIPTGLGAGFYCNIFLNNASAQAITTTGLTLRGTPGANISAYGLISILAIAADTFYIKGETE